MRADSSRRADPVRHVLADRDALSLPGIAVTSFHSFITAWNEVAFANVILTENDTYTLPVGLRTYVFQFDQAACDEIANRQLTLSYGATGTQTLNDAVLNWRNVSPCGN